MLYHVNTVFITFAGMNLAICLKWFCLNPSESGLVIWTSEERSGKGLQHKRLNCKTPMTILHNREEKKERSSSV